MESHREFESAVYAQRAGELPHDEGIRGALEKAVPWYAEFLKPWLPRKLDAAVMDVPCGHGNLLFALKRLGYQNARGVDLDSAQVALARSFGLNAEIGDCFEAIESVEANSIQAIFSLDFLEHLHQQDALRFLRLCYSALCPGGHFVCRTPSADGPLGSSDRHNDLTHFFGMTSGALSTLLRMGGFTPGDIEVHGEEPVPYKFTNRVRRFAFDVTTGLAGFWMNFIGVGRPAIWTRSMWGVARKQG